VTFFALREGVQGAPIGLQNGRGFGRELNASHRTLQGWARQLQPDVDVPDTLSASARFTWQQGGFRMISMRLFASKCTRRPRSRNAAHHLARGADAAQSRALRQGSSTTHFAVLPEIKQQSGHAAADVHQGEAADILGQRARAGSASRSGGMRSQGEPPTHCASRSW
jgi:hypothetical protein